MSASAVSASLSPSGWNWLAQLADEGCAIVRGLVPDALTQALSWEVRHLHEQDLLSRAGVGRTDDFQLATNLRRDKTRWFDRSSQPQSDYMDLMEMVRLKMNQELFLGLFSFEAHYAVYEKGSYYKRHLDAFKGARNRVLSTVFYLNDDWQAQNGGALVIYKTSGRSEPVQTIYPEFGTLVVFLSEDIPHEVLPTTRNRYSIAGWFRVNDRMTAPGLQAPSSLVSDY